MIGGFLVTKSLSQLNFVEREILFILSQIFQGRFQTVTSHTPATPPPLSSLYDHIHLIIPSRPTF
jgi:hypothetical protein